MNDILTQARLSMRLDNYLSNYTKKIDSNNDLYRKEWNNVWQVADAARVNNTLTPEIVDDVRIALNKL